MVENHFNNLEEVPEYTTYPRTLEGYKWYKPILTLVLGIVIYIIVVMVYGAIMYTLFPGMLNGISSFSYDDVNTYTFKGVASFFIVVLFIPVLYLASRITNERAFTTFTSSRGGWNWRIFTKSSLVSFICISIPIIVMDLMMGRLRPFEFTIFTLILTIILVPLQCVAEEYVFRGLIMQTLGSWIKVPIIAVIIQTLIFTWLHPYNLLGQISIFIMGLIYGLAAYYFKGLEVSSAMHILNNLSSALMLGIGFGIIQTNVNMLDFTVTTLSSLLALAVLYILEKKYNWITS